MRAVFRFLRSQADPERRAALTVLVAMRWVLLAASLFQVNYRPGSDPAEFALLNTLIGLAALLNAMLQARLFGGRPIQLWFPVLLGFYDAVAVTGAIAVIDRFDNPSYVLYYPALLSFVLVFPGRWSVIYTLGMMLVYAIATVPDSGSFATTNASDQKALVLRLLTMATAALTANLVVKVERQRRLAAVAEVVALEQQAAETRESIEEARRRLSEEVHDGVSQDVYMLTLGLETAQEAARRAGDSDLETRLGALHRLSQQTLLETRNLLFDLRPVMSGEIALAELVRNQCREFSAVSGIAMEVDVDGEERSPDPSTVSELFRILQESFSNVMRHSGATYVRVRLHFVDDELELTVADDGRGFDAATVRRGHGLGNIVSRAERLGGTGRIDSSAGKGCTVMIRIPMVAVPA